MPWLMPKRVLPLLCKYFEACVIETLMPMLGMML